MELCGKTIRYLDPKPALRVNVPIEEAGGWIIASCTKALKHDGRCVSLPHVCGAAGPEVEGVRVVCERAADPNHPPAEDDDPIHKNAHRATGGNGIFAWTLEWSEVS